MDEAIDKRAEMMGTARVPSAIIKLAIPAIISMAVMAIYNMADTYFVSISPEGYLGTAAVSVYMPVMLITQALSILFAAGGAAYLSRLLGAKEKEKAGRTATTTITLCPAFWWPFWAVFLQSRCSLRLGRRRGRLAWRSTMRL